MKLIGLHLIIPKVKSLISIVYSIFTTFMLQGGSILKDKSNVYLPHVRSYYEPSK